MLLALGVAVFFFLKMRRYLPERARGAELAPAETVLFVQFPNLRQTALRFPRTDLYQIWREPDVQAFMEKPRSKAPWMIEWGKRLEEMARVAPGEAFLAFTATDGPRPSFVGGFSYAGRQHQAEALATHLREQLLPGQDLASVLRTNWVLFATDADRLARMVERFDGKPGPALAADPAFQKAISSLGIGQDLVIYGKPEALSGQLDVLSGFRGKTAPGSSQPLAMATKFDGGKVRDAIFIPGGGTFKETALSRQTLSVASPQTLLYYVADLTVLPPDFNMLTGFLPGFAEMERSLAEKGLSWSDLPNAVAPEVGVMVEWAEDAALPTLLLASETRDLAKARGFAGVLLGRGPAGLAWSAKDHAGIALLSASPQAFAVVRPALAVTDRYTLLGLSPEVVESALPRTTSGSVHLGQTTAFQDLAPFVPREAVAFGYLDFQRLFERVYRMARPFITLSLAFSAEAGAQFDAGKLPPVEAVSKHLSATVITQTRTEDGMLIESIGSLTLPELLFGISAGGIASGLPDLSAALGGGAKRATPPTPKITPKSRVEPPVRDADAAAASPVPEKKPAEHK